MGPAPAPATPMARCGLRSTLPARHWQRMPTALAFATPPPASHELAHGVLNEQASREKGRAIVTEKRSLRDSAMSITSGTREDVDSPLVEALRRDLTAAIDALPPDYRPALVLHDVEGVANSEIAETLGVGLPTVKSRVHRARLFVRQRLSTYLESAS